MAKVPVEQLEVVIQANADQFRKELADVNQRLGTMAGASNAGASALAGKLFPAMTAANLASKAITSTLRGVARATSNLTKKVLEGGGAYARISTSVDTVAHNMGISAQEVNNLRDALADANTYGVKAEQVIRSLAMTGLFEMAKSLEAVDARTGGVETGITALVLTMKDLAASAGKESAEGIDTLTRFIQGNNQAVQEGILQIGNMGTEYRQYAASLGKSRTELTAQEEAQVRMNIVMREGQKAFGAYAQTYTSSGKMIGSITEAMQANYEILGSALEPIFATLSSAVLTFVNNVRRFLLNNIDTITNWAVKVSASIIMVIRTLGRLASRIPVIGRFMTGLATFEFPKVSVSADNTTKSLGGYAQGVDNASESTKALKKELAGLAGFDEMNVLKAPDEGAGAGTTGLAGGGLDVSPEGTQGLVDLGDIAEQVRARVERLTGKLEDFKILTGEIFNFQNWLDVTGLNSLWENTMSSWNASWETWGPVIQGNLREMGVSVTTYLIKRGLLWVTIITDVWKDFTEIWKENSSGVIDSTLEMIARLTGVFNQLWTNILEPIIMPFVDVFRKMWDEVLRDAVASVWEYILKLIEFVNVFYNKFIYPIISFLLDKLKPTFQNIGKMISAVLEAVLGVVGHVIKGVFGWASGLLDYLIGVFTGDWKRAWMGIVKMFTSLFSGIVGIGKSVINLFIDTINQMIYRINKIKVPDWVGGKMGGKGLNIQSIPRLAQGAVVDNPMLSVIGEEGEEVVMPLENNTGWITELADMLNERGGGGQPINLTVKIGEDEVADKMVEAINDKAMRTGTNLLKA